MFKTRLRIALVVAAVLLPFILHQVYSWITALPRDIVVATGPENGLYRGMWKELGREIKDQLKVNVRFRHTGGSTENLELLENGEVDFCLCQGGTDHFLGRRDKLADHQPKFVANLYSEVVHILVRPEAGIRTAADLRGKRINIGDKGSGDNAMAMLLLDHVGLTEKEFKPDRVNYHDLAPKFRKGAIDAAIVTIAPGAPLVTDLIADGTCELIPTPYPQALSEKRLFIQPYEIPAGLYGAGDDAHPRQPIPTVAVRAQLLTSDQVSATLVGEVTRIALSEEFIKSRELTELFSQGTPFARAHPEFSLHPGATNYYEPESRTYLDPDFVEMTENARSFVVSILIAGFFYFRWLGKRSQRGKEHRLDRYIHALLAIERKQMSLDSDSTVDDITALQSLLDEVTTLRQEALSTFTAHELNEESATDAFLEMCHALSDKVNAKLSRQRLDKRFDELRNETASDST